MPIVRIEDATQRSLAEQRTLVEAVYASLRQQFGVSDEELQARYHYLPATSLRTPGDRDGYVQITITLFKGRKAATKRKLYADIVDRLARALSIDPGAVLILLDEHDAENWGMRGGIAASDIDFGYAVQV